MHYIIHILCNDFHTLHLILIILFWNFYRMHSIIYTWDLYISIMTRFYASYSSMFMHCHQFIFLCNSFYAFHVAQVNFHCITYTHICYFSFHCLTFIHIIWDLQSSEIKSKLNNGKLALCITLLCILCKERQNTIARYICIHKNSRTWYITL